VDEEKPEQEAPTIAGASTDVVLYDDSNANTSLYNDNITKNPRTIGVVINNVMLKDINYDQ
jgi:hypothetical protein